MENVNILTGYLNPKKYAAISNFKKVYHLIRIDSDFLDENQDPSSDDITKIIRNELPVTYGLNGGFNPINIYYPLVVTRDGDDVGYYFQRDKDGVTKYVSLEHALLPNTNESHFLFYDHLTFISIDLQFIHYYNLEDQQIYSVDIALPEITLFGHKTLAYNPKHLGGLTNGEYELDYKNAAGYTNVPIEIIIGELLMEQSRQEHKKRIINVSFFEQTGKIYWYPKIGTEDGKITLYYEYHPILNDHFDIPLANGRMQPAIKLVFNYIEGFLAFMQLTYFANGVSLLDMWEGSGFRKKDFFKSYVKIIIEYLKLNEDHIYGILTILYYVPIDLFIKEHKLFKKKGTSDTIVGEEFIWSCIDRVLRIPISNYTINVEDITLKLFEILEIIQKYKNHEGKEVNDYILDQLLLRRFNGQSYLLAFYDRMNTNNFVKYNYLIYKIWRNSSYINPEKEIYKETTYLTKFTDTDKKDKQKPPRMLAYETNKVIGFYTSNINTEFNEKENIVFTPDAYWIDDVLTFFQGEEQTRGITAFIEGDWEITYHPLYPIFLPNPTEKSAIQVQKISPALLIKASEDKAFWSNVGTTAAYTFDILTTLSGVGNLAKFRHLARISEAAGIIKNGIKLKNVFYVYKAAKGTLATVEISSGTINILLKITGVAETPFGRALTNFLFWMEMLTLSVNLFDAISGGLKANADLMIKDSDVLGKKLDEFVAAKQIDEADKARVVREIRKISEAPSDYSTRFATKVDISKDIAPHEIKYYDELFRSQKQEWGGMYNSLTKYKAYHASGGDGFVNFPDEMLRQTRRSILTHNHPNGAALSLDDLKFFITNQLSEIRAVLPNGDIFSLRNGRIFDPASDIRSINFDIDTQLILRQIDHLEAKHLNSNITLSEFDAKVFEEAFDLIKNKVTYTHYVKK